MAQMIPATKVIEMRLTFCFQRRENELQGVPLIRPWRIWFCPAGSSKCRKTNPHAANSVYMYICVCIYLYISVYICMRFCDVLESWFPDRFPHSGALNQFPKWFSNVFGIMISTQFSTQRSFQTILWGDFVVFLNLVFHPAHSTMAKLIPATRMTDMRLTKSFPKKFYH